MLVAASLAAPVRAEDALDAAKRAYDRGASAYDAGDYATAASELLRADEIVSSDITLELALKAAVKADDPSLAMRLADRAEGRSKSPSLSAAAEAARTKMGPRTGKITVSCHQGMACTATLDDAPIATAQPTWISTGEHRVVFDAAGKRQAFTVRVAAKASVDVVQSAVLPSTEPAAPPPPDPGSAADRSGGISPAWFWASLGVTAVFGGACVASAIDTKNKHDAFVARPSSELSEGGADAQLRTNLFLASAGVSAVAAAVLGLFFVQWGKADAHTARARVL